MRLVVIIPAYGREDLTTSVVGDIAREAEHTQQSIDCLIVDNQGGYRPCWREGVVRPGRNLGWLDGSNTGLEEAQRSGYDVYILLNNDVRLSRGFFDGLVRAEKLTQAGLLAPAYDATLPHQRMPHTGAAETYRPKRRHWKASIVDGTCMYIPAATLTRVGLLDTRFNPYGWGAEIDYSFRVWDAGMRVVVTALSFINHQQGGTSDEVHGGKTYHEDAYLDMVRGLAEKYGTGSRGWGPRSGINPETHWTEPLTSRQRLVGTIRAEARARLGRAAS